MQTILRFQRLAKKKKKKNLRAHFFYNQIKICSDLNYFNNQHYVEVRFFKKTYRNPEFLLRKQKQ